MWARRCTFFGGQVGIHVAGKHAVVVEVVEILRLLCCDRDLLRSGAGIWVSSSSIRNVSNVIVEATMKRDAQMLTGHVMIVPLAT